MWAARGAPGRAARGVTDGVSAGGSRDFKSGERTAAGLSNCWCILMRWWTRSGGSAAAVSSSQRESPRRPPGLHVPRHTSGSVRARRATHHRSASRQDEKERTRDDAPDGGVIALRERVEVLVDADCSARRRADELRAPARRSRDPAHCRHPAASDGCSSDLGDLRRRRLLACGHDSGRINGWARRRRHERAGWPGTPLRFALHGSCGGSKRDRTHLFVRRRRRAGRRASRLTRARHRCFAATRVLKSHAAAATDARATSRSAIKHLLRRGAPEPSWSRSAGRAWPPLTAHLPGEKCCFRTFRVNVQEVEHLECGL